jgi:hypothetical protein
LSDVILQRLLIYKRKNNGPSIDPWGTRALLASFQKNIEFSVFNITLWYIPCK